MFSRKLTLSSSSKKCCPQSTKSTRVLSWLYALNLLFTASIAGVYLQNAKISNNFHQTTLSVIYKLSKMRVNVAETLTQDLPRQNPSNKSSPWEDLYWEMSVDLKSSKLIALFLGSKSALDSIPLLRNFSNFLGQWWQSCTKLRSRELS